MRRSMAGAIAAHMQRQAALSRHEGARETLVGLCSWPVASLLKVSFRLASVKKHWSRSNTFARSTTHRDAGAPQRLAGRRYCLGSAVDSDRSESVDSTRDKSLSKLDVGVGL